MGNSEVKCVVASSASFPCADHVCAIFFTPVSRSRVLDHAIFSLVMIVWSRFDWVRISPESNRNFCVDLSDYGNAKPGTPVELWGRWDGDNQKWRLDKV